MTQQETGGGGTGEPTLTEEVQSQQVTASDNGTENPALSTDAAPILNRAERRAQAKGKKGPSNGSGQTSGGGVTRGPSAKPSGQAGAVRFPRTGHK